MEVRMNGYTPNDSLLRHWNVLWNELEPARKQAPAADVVEDADAYHFYFEMAGINSQSVDVRVEDGSLIVEAREDTSPPRFQLHWAGQHTAKGRGDCGAQADLTLDRFDLQRLANAAGGFGVKPTAFR